MTIKNDINNKGLKMTRDKKYVDMMNQWFILKQEGKGIEKYFQKNGYYSIAIYGMSIYGRHLVRELQGTDINIVYGIDQKRMNPYKNIKVLQPFHELPDIDVIVNTVIFEHTNIKKSLLEITNSPVICLEDIIFERYDLE